MLCVPLVLRKLNSESSFMLCLRQDRKESISISGQRLGGWVGPQQLSRRRSRAREGILFMQKEQVRKKGVLVTLTCTSPGEYPLNACSHEEWRRRPANKQGFIEGFSFEV